MNYPDITWTLLPRHLILVNKYYRWVHAFTRQFGCLPINYLCEVEEQGQSKEPPPPPPPPLPPWPPRDYSITEGLPVPAFSSSKVILAQRFRSIAG